MKAIETEYHGYRFRSRLEARWAVFFDAMGYEWRYEHQGYEAGGKRYLPDFELVTSKGYVFFVEVKGDKEALAKDFERYTTLLDWGGCLPDFEDSYDEKNTGLILLGEIPDGNAWGTYFHPIIQHRQGLHRDWMFFGTGSPVGQLPVEASPNYLRMLCGIEPDNCIEGSGEHWIVETRHVHTPKAISSVLEAYRLARAARFEHGQAPVPRIQV